MIRILVLTIAFAVPLNLSGQTENKKPPATFQDYIDAEQAKWKPGDDPVRFSEFRKTDRYRQITEEYEMAERMAANMASPNFVATLSRLIENKQMFDDLEWTEEQKTEINLLIKEFRALDDAQSNPETALTLNELNSRRLEIGKKFSNLFIDFQANDLASLQMHQGDVLGILMHSAFLRKSLKVTDRQLDQIQKNSNAIGNEIQEFIVKKRKQAALAVANELTPEQNHALTRLYGSQVLDGSFAESPVELFYLRLMRGSESHRSYFEGGNHAPVLRADIQTWKSKDPVSQKNAAEAPVSPKQHP